MADQLKKVRETTQEKLRKEAEVVVEVEKPSALQTAAASHLSKKDEHPLSQNLNEETLDEDVQSDVKKALAKGKFNYKLVKKGNKHFVQVNFNDAEEVGQAIKNIPLYIAGKLRVQPLGESNLNEDEKNALAGFDNRVRDAASMDRKDIIKAKELYKRKDVKRLRQHIYTLDTEPLETIMQNISVQDRKFFDKMYPKNKSGQFLAMIAYDHRKMDEELDEKRKPESKSDFLKRNKKAGYAAAEKEIAQMKKDRMKNAKVKLKMGESLDEGEKGIDKLPRQFLNPDKEVMVMKKNKVVVIDKKDQDRYTKQGWALAEVLDKDDEGKVKDVVKQLKKAVKAHSGQAKDLEKAVNEWFKSKNTDVKVRKLDESTQVYVPLGRRIPNEIREELITTQYGKMPEDVKNVKDINYGNFMENSITMNNDFWNKVLHGTKGE